MVPKRRGNLFLARPLVEPAQNCLGRGALGDQVRALGVELGHRQLHDRLAGFNRLRFADENLAHATANPRAEADFLRFDRSREAQLGPLLPVLQEETDTGSRGGEQQHADCERLDEHGKSRFPADGGHGRRPPAKRLACGRNWLLLSSAVEPAFSDSRRRKFCGFAVSLCWSFSCNHRPADPGWALYG